MPGPRLFDSFEDEPQIDLTPLIDCLFMLIIFFVLTMSFSRPVLEIVLPTAQNPEHAAARNEFLVAVSADGSFWLDQKSVTLEEISAKLDAEPEKLLNIYMDEKAGFAHFVRILDLAKAKRAGRFVISTNAQAQGATASSAMSPAVSPATPAAQPSAPK